MAEHWDGTLWQTTPTPTLPDASTVLQSVAAVSASDAWAVGYAEGAFKPGTDYHLWLLHCDGTVWTVV